MDKSCSPNERLAQVELHFQNVCEEVIQMILTTKYNFLPEKGQYEVSFGEKNATLITLKKYEVLFL